MATDSFEATIDLGGEPVTVRVTRDATGELHLGSPDDTSVVEELLVYDLGDDADDAAGLARLLREVGTGATEPAVRAWNVTRLDVGPVTSELRLQLPDVDQPVQVATRELHDLVARYAEFLGA